RPRPEAHPRRAGQRACEAARAGGAHRRGRDRDELAVPEPPNIPPGPPLVSYPDGLPLLYDVLGVDLYLEPLGPDDVDRLDRAMALVAGWIGPMLRWTGCSALQGVRAFQPSDLELVSCHPHQLKNDRQPPAGRIQASAIATFEVACHGGKDRPS